MIDLNILENYRENNRIEAKKALGGLPHSIWETYSAFANTLGGVILLGVEEYRDKTFHTVDLPDPERLRKEFWDAVNDPKKASVNILSAKDVHTEIVNGNHILVINVPKAERFDKPVYVEGDPLNTYRRNGEGDYKCTKEEIRAMVRDASVRTVDMAVLEDLETDIFDPESLRKYRQRMKISHPGLKCDDPDNDSFLPGIGAAAAAEDGKIHPTAAGLLMFGKREDIVRVFPHFSPEYREEYPENPRLPRSSSPLCSDRIENVLDFYFRVCSRLLQSLEMPAFVKKGTRLEADPVPIAIREVLVNSIVNADYYSEGGLSAVRTKDTIRISNPGIFRVEVDSAKNGSISDPRNSLLQKMFNLIRTKEWTGGSISNIFRIWKEQNWQEPEILQKIEPDRTVIILPLPPAEGGKKTVTAAGNGTCLPESAENDNAAAEMRKPIPGDTETAGDPAETAGRQNKTAIRQIKRQMIIDYLTEHIEVTAAELAAWVGLKPSGVRVYLRELIRDQIVTAQGNTRSRVYRLKS